MKSEMERIPLRERNRLRIEKSIVNAAFELFSAAGYDQTTMDDIAEKAEISRGTLFNYFPTKETLLIPFSKEMYQKRIQPEVISYLDTQPTTIQALRFLFMSIHKHILTLPQIDRALKQEFSHHKPTRKETLNSIGFLDNLINILHYGQQRGEVRTDIPVEKLARYLGVLYVSSLFHNVVEQVTSTDYTTEVDTLLAFMSTALH